MPLSPGVKAPDFDEPSHDGTQVALRKRLEDGPVVLFFYPKDETRVCTAEARAFRDAYEDFVEAGATVIGVSHDDEASHRRFAERHRLPFLLLSDGAGKLRRAYGVKNKLGLVPGRVTFVIGPDGTVAHAFESMFDAGGHVSEALRVVRELSSTKAASS